MFNTTSDIGMNKIYMYTNERERERENFVFLTHKVPPTICSKHNFKFCSFFKNNK